MKKLWLLLLIVPSLVFAERYNVIMSGGTQDITGVKFAPSPSISSQLATKAYVDGVAGGGTGFDSNATNWVRAQISATESNLNSSILTISNAQLNLLSSYNYLSNVVVGTVNSIDYLSNIVVALVGTTGNYLTTSSSISEVGGIFYTTTNQLQTGGVFSPINLHFGYSNTCCTVSNGQVWVNSAGMYNVKAHAGALLAIADAQVYNTFIYTNNVRAKVQLLTMSGSVPPRNSIAATLYLTPSVGLALYVYCTIGTTNEVSADFTSMSVTKVGGNIRP